MDSNVSQKDERSESEEVGATHQLQTRLVSRVQFREGVNEGT